MERVNLVSQTKQGKVLIPNGLDVLSAYEQLLAWSNQMLSRVRAEDWAGLIELELEYVSDIERLSQFESTVHLDEREQLQKLELVQQLLDQDREIRERLMKRKTELEGALATMNRQQQLADRYRN
ncbi:flagellar protein FliT [Pseudidiomarina insulisalsae]|uniref:Flagellar protein FliT n=1 Tax=Pseudidiomarina insulisalsae TaxID=575789 RepID=A0A432YDS2_9GAMM|nr:flagellar protein FliT [Pseudidiomarina insulisalsae]RUO59063.1 hypothetical protein CWI71_09600 [Pseudidiomarina insulisalsae]